MKKLAYALLILVLVAGGAMYWLAGNLDHLAKQAITHYGNAMTQARISVDVVKKLIVEKLTIRNIRAQASTAFMGGRTVTVPLPDISMKNVGKAKGGISPGELGQEVANALEAKLVRAVNFNRLMQSTGETFNRAAPAVSGFFR